MNNRVHCDLETESYDLMLEAEWARELFGFITLPKALGQRCWGLKGKLMSRSAHRDSGLCGCVSGTLCEKGPVEN